MKTLYIIRHAKSDWSASFSRDFDRPLNERGEKNAKSMGKYLKKKKIFPDKVFSSSAKRAKSTIEIISKEISYDKDKIVFEEDIYNYHMKGIDFYLSYLMGVKDKNKVVFLVGHNNSLSELVSYLLGKKNLSIPTAGVVGIDFYIDSWKDINYANGKLVFCKFPKDI